MPRRPVRIHADDPRRPRKLRQESGVNLMHEDAFFGFNVGRKIPARGTADPTGVTFDGLPGDRIAVDAITSAELKTTGDADAAVSSGAVQTGAVIDRWFPFETGIGRRLPGTVQILRDSLVDDVVSLAKIDEAVKGSLSGGPSQGVKGLREIGNTLGGSARAAAAGDHSHGSGNSTDFDLLPQAHQDRILLARQRVRDNVRTLDALTAAQFRLFVRELAIVAVAALNLEIEAPDYTAEERMARRKSGDPLPLFHEWRVPEGGSLFDPTKPRYTQGLPDVGGVPE